MNNSLKTFLIIGAILIPAFAFAQLNNPSGGGTGDITAIFNCLTGDCEDVVVGATDSLDFSATDSTAGKGLVLPQHADTCPASTDAGAVCLDVDNDILQISDGSALRNYLPNGAFSGDATVSASGVVAIQANSVALTTDTTGNYAAGDAEAGAATTGDSATSFFSSGTIAVGQGGTGASSLTDGGVLLGNGTGAIVALGVLADSNFLVGDGTTDPVAESGATVRTSLGLGSMATQASDAVSISGGAVTGITDVTVADGGTGVSTLTDGGVLLGNGTGAIVALGVLADSNFLVGDGTTDPVAESGATVRTSLGLGSIATQASDAVSISGGAVTGITDVTVADGGTGVSTLTDGGVLIGNGTGAIVALGVLADSTFIVGDGTTDPVAESGATVRTSLGLGTGNTATFTGVVTNSVDGSGAVDIDYGSADITDHTFVTDGTGTAEFVLPAGSIDSAEILDATILEVDLKAVDAAADEECLTFESTTGDFEWQACASGGGEAAFTAESDPGTDPTATGTDDLAMGETAVANGAGAIAIGELSDAGNAAGDNGAIAIGSLAQALGGIAVAIGENATASGINSSAIGADSDATGYDSLAVGNGAQATGGDDVAVGDDAVSSASMATSIGRLTVASDVQAVAIGANADATGANCVAVGGHTTDASSADCVGANSVAVGVNTLGTGTESVAVGDSAVGTGVGDIAIGDTATANGAGAIAIGVSSDSGNASGDAVTIAIGHSAQALGPNTIAIGSAAATPNDGSIAIGKNAIVGAVDQAVAIGMESDVGGANGIAIGGGGGVGVGANAAGAQSISIGRATDATGVRDVALGDASTANGAAAIAIGYLSDAGNASGDAGAIALGANSQALGPNGVAIGNAAIASFVDAIAMGADAAATVDHAIAIGTNSTASGDSCVAIGGHSSATLKSDCTAQSAVAIGIAADATATNAVAIGGGNGATSGAFATAAESVALGFDTLASGIKSVALGSGTETPDYGQLGFTSGNFAAASDARTSIYVLRNNTTDATQTELFSDATDDDISLASDCTAFFDASIVARQTDADGVSAAYTIKGVFDNNAGTTAFVGSVAVVTVGEDVAGWNVTATADNTADGLNVLVTGAAGDAVRWVARVEVTQTCG